MSVQYPSSGGGGSTNPSAPANSFQFNNAGSFGGAVLLYFASIPADGALSIGQIGLWYDDTTGSAQLNFKAKQADGSVVLGAIALS